MSTHHDDPHAPLRRRPWSSALLAALAIAIAHGTAAAFQGNGVTTDSTSAKASPDRILVPEIDPALTGGMIVLLVGGVLILTSRRRRAAAA